MGGNLPEHSHFALIPPPTPPIRLAPPRSIFSGWPVYLRQFPFPPDVVASQFADQRISKISPNMLDYSLLRTKLQNYMPLPPRGSMLD